MVSAKSAACLPVSLLIAANARSVATGPDSQSAEDMQAYLGHCSWSLFSLYFSLWRSVLRTGQRTIAYHSVWHRKRVLNVTSFKCKNSLFYCTVSVGKIQRSDSYTPFYKDIRDNTVQQKKLIFMSLKRDYVSLLTRTLERMLSGKWIRYNCILKLYTILTVLCCVCTAKVCLFLSYMSFPAKLGIYKPTNDCKIHDQSQVLVPTTQPYHHERATTEIT